MSRVLTSVFLLLTLMAGIVAVGGYFWWQSVHSSSAPDVQSLVYRVVPGANIRSVSRDLEDIGLVSNRWLLESWARFEGKQGALKTGEYALSGEMTVAEMLDILVAGQSLQYKVTFPEGMTVAEMVSELHQHDMIEPELALPKLQEQLKALTGLPHSEGWFYPDTYLFTKGVSDLDVLKMAHEKMEIELAKAWALKDDGLPLNSPLEVLTLASIVEKETGVGDERPMIAGVFIQRLNKGMRLQTDPTVIYGMGDRYQGNIRKSDLRRDTPYNTYTRAGLPPTPIASPGREALLAAVQPEKTDALFFVAKGGGRHHFSNTYKEHRSAVIKYQLGGKASRYQGDK